MPKSLITASLGTLRWALCAVGAVALLITALVAVPLTRPPELASISAARGTVDLSTLPPIERFQARDGTGSASAIMPARGPATGRAAIVVHGSSGSSGGTIHALSQALAARGVETFAVDMRGHGVSGTRGDIGYVGQLENDLADFVADRPQDRADGAADAGRPFLRRRFCAARRGLADPDPVRAHRAARALSRLGRADHAAELRRLGQGGHSPHRRPAGAARASASTAAMRCRCWPSRCRRIRTKNLVASLQRPADAQFRRHRGFPHAISPRRPRPVTIISGADDELMFADKYAEAVKGAAVPVDVKLIDGVNHMGIVSTPGGGIHHRR